MNYFIDILFTSGSCHIKDTVRESRDTTDTFKVQLLMATETRWTLRFNHDRNYTPIIVIVHVMNHSKSIH